LLACAATRVLPAKDELGTFADLDRYAPAIAIVRAYARS